VGRLFYQGRAVLDVDDRTLAHLRVVMMNKLRRGESFMLHAPHPSAGTLSLWLSASTPLVLQFWGGRSPSLDQHLVERMFDEANGPNGLTLHVGKTPSAHG